MESFNKRWKIKSKRSYQEEFKMFKQRVMNIFKEIDMLIEKEGVKQFCLYYGIEEVWYGNGMSPSTSDNIFKHLNAEWNEKEFYRAIELIFSLDMKPQSDLRYGISIDTKAKLYREFLEVLKFSKVNLAVAISNNDIVLYPQGETMLDMELVNYPLSILDSKSGKHFIDGLKFYEDNNAVKSAESLRRTIEEFLRHKLKNKKGLKENIRILGGHMKDNNIDMGLRNVIIDDLNKLNGYFDEESKHNDGEIGERVNEFLIYKIGLLIRYIGKAIK